MWRFTTVLLAILVAICCTEGQTFGKSEAQILAMGRGNWLGFHLHASGDEDRQYHGETTESMAVADNLWAQAAAHRNNRLIASRRKAAAWKKLHPLLREFSSCACEITLEWAGDDTGVEGRYDRATNRADSEDEIYEILRGRPAKVRPMSTAAVRRKIQLASDDVRRETSEYKRAPGVLRRWRTVFALISSLVKELPTSERYRVLRFCYANSTIKNV